MLVHFTMLPRIAVALMAGGGLGLAGAILQRILRNPLAEPATLGISAGAYLMLAIAGVIIPGLVASAGEWVSFAGAGLALLAILGLSWRKGLSPITVSLSGLVISLYCGAVSAVLALFFRDFLVGQLLWGAGYLDQQDWSAVQFLAPRLAMIVGMTASIVRPLGLLETSDETARSLGLSITAYRGVGLALAAALTAIVTTSVGIISFVGLAAPALARASGVRTAGRHLVWSSLIGAFLLAATDQAVQSLPVTFRLFPTGAVTALLGAPLLLLLLNRLKLLAPPQAVATALPVRLAHPESIILILLVVLLVMGFLALSCGQGPDGWACVSGETFRHLVGWRWPRALAAFSGGAMLALAGAILQRTTGNPMASPEVLGVSSGAMLGVIILMLVSSAPTRSLQIGAGAAGAFAVLALMRALSAKPGYAGDRLLLIGISLGSVASFLIAIVMVSQDPRLEMLLAWLSGSTYAVGAGEAKGAMLVLFVGLASVPFIRRWLELMALGAPAARALGVSLATSRTLLFSIAALLTAAATILVGPLSFAGLMGPHLARLLGFQRAGGQLVAAALIGGLILLIADWLGRNLVFPFQIPAGLLATLVGGPLFLGLIGRRS